jgi:hypothetical protein
MCFPIHLRSGKEVGTGDEEVKDNPPLSQTKPPTPDVLDQAENRMDASRTSPKVGETPEGTKTQQGGHSQGLEEPESESDDEIFDVTQNEVIPH